MRQEAYTVCEAKRVGTSQLLTRMSQGQGGLRLPVALPKVNRLKHRLDFSAVFRQGIRRQSPHLTLRALQQKPKTAESAKIPPIIGISVSQKVSKLATQRNRIKRQLRAAFRQLLPRLKSDWLLVVVVKPKATECDYQHFLQELEQLLADAEVINGH